MAGKYRNKGSKSSLFLIELIITVFFFSLTSIVCVRLFLYARSISDSACRTTAAVHLAQNAAESFYAAKGDPRKTLSLFEMTLQEGASVVSAGDETFIGEVDSDHASLTDAFIDGGFIDDNFVDRNFVVGNLVDGNFVDDNFVDGQIPGGYAMDAHALEELDDPSAGGFAANAVYWFDGDWNRQFSDAKYYALLGFEREEILEDAAMCRLQILIGEPESGVVIYSLSLEYYREDTQ